MATPRTTFHDTSLQVRTVVDVFDFMSPLVVPALKLFSGGSDEKPSLNSLSTPCKAKKYEWLEYTDPPFTTLLTEADDGSETALDVTTGTGQYFTKGTLFMIGSEIFLTVSVATDTVTVASRPYGAISSAAAHDSGATVTIMGNASLETDDFATSWVKEAAAQFNYVQLFADQISVTEMAEAIEMYGIDDALEFETANKTRRLMRQLNRTVYMGKKYVGTSALAGAMGGLDEFIPAANITDLSSGTLETSHIEDAMRDVFDDAGADNVPDTIICGSLVRSRINKIFANSGVVTYRDQKERRGGVLIDYIDTTFGSFDMMIDHDCPAAVLYMVKADKIGIGPLQDMAFKREPLAKTGPVTRFGLYGVYTMEVRNRTSHAKITNIAQTI